MFNSFSAKQLGGALAGMALAGLVYVAAGHMDLANIKGYLVQPNQNISENVGQLSANSKTLDETSFERLARRAAAVETQLQNAATDTGTPQTALNQNAEARKQARLGATEIATANANPQTYENTNAVVTQYDRLALRAANTAQALADGHSGAPLYQPNMQVVTPEEQFKGKKGVVTPIPQVIETPVPQQPQTIIKEVQVPMPTPQKTVIKEVQVPVPGETRTVIKEVPIPQPVRTVVEEVPVYGKNLPGSGLGLNLLLVASFLGAGFVLCSDLKQRLVASFVRAS